MLHIRHHREATHPAPLIFGPTSVSGHNFRLCFVLLLPLRPDRDAAAEDTGASHTEPLFPTLVVVLKLSHGPVLL